MIFPRLWIGWGNEEYSETGFLEDKVHWRLDDGEMRRCGDS